MVYCIEYGYFSRNKSYDRNLFITAGDMEDEDYEEYYGDNDSTLEGAPCHHEIFTATFCFLTCI
jgi:hypothetical protein